MTLEDLIRQLVAKYSDDPSAPSVVLSYLADRERWYASAIRYCRRYGEGKVVVCNATGESLEAVLASLASELGRIWSLQASPLQFEFIVAEEYDSEPSEEFGSWTGPRPVAGDVVQLKWLDGKDAYRVRVLRVNEEHLRLRVKALEVPVEVAP